MNFKQFQTDIKAFISDKLPVAVEASNLSAINAFIDDFLDLDKYKQSTLVFYDFTDYHFENLSLQSQEMTGTLHLYIVLRNFNQSNLKDSLTDYTTCLSDWFYGDICKRSFGGIVDIGIISDIDFYNAAAGNTNIKVADIAITYRLEDTND